MLVTLHRKEDSGVTDMLCSLSYFRLSLFLPPKIIIIRLTKLAYKHTYSGISDKKHALRK